MISDNADYNPLDDGILVYNLDKENFTEVSERNEAIMKVCRIINERPKSLIVEINTYRKYVPIVIKTLYEREKVLKDLNRQFDRIESKTNARHNQRWSDDEDKMLIDMICSGDYSMFELSSVMGRSVSAIRTRLSTLVGMKRLSQEVAGKFIGTIDGVAADGNIVGTVYKK